MVAQADLDGYEKGDRPFALINDLFCVGCNGH